MKKAFGVLELLIVLVISIALFLMFNPKTGRNNPFEDLKRAKTQEQIVNDKLKEIEDLRNLNRQVVNDALSDQIQNDKVNEIENTKKLNEQIQNNLNEDF